jgi:xanthine dehydrogenase YagR molybdenum-binding subunit
MKFDTPAGTNPIDRLRVIGRPANRIEGPLKTTGTAKYAYEYSEQDIGGKPAYGFVLGAAIGKGRIASINDARARSVPGVLAIVTAANAGKVGVGAFYVDRALAGPDVDHYGQAVAIVIAETFEQARDAASLVDVQYVRAEGSFDLKAAKDTAFTPKASAFGPPPQSSIGDFDGAFAAAPVTLDEVYTTPDQSHAMMEPHVTIAAWKGDRLTCWCPIQQLNWGVRDLGLILGIPKENTAWWPPTSVAASAARARCWPTPCRQRSPRGPWGGR